MLLTIILGICTTWRCAKIDFYSFKKTFSPSLKTRYEAVKSLRSINDPVMKKIGAFINKFGLFCLLAWFVILVLTICVVLYLDHIGVWRELIKK